MEKKSELFDCVYCTAINIKYKNLVLGKIYYCLAERIFGDGKEALNAFIHIKRMIQGMRIGPGVSNICRYKTRFFQSNSYLLYYPWNSGW